MTTIAGHLARNTAAFIAVLALAAPALGQPCLPLSAANPDGNYIVPGVMGGIRYSRDLSLDAYVQRGAGGRPSVVVVHGGSWSSGSRAAHVGQILELLTAAGYNWFSVDYRLAGLAHYDDSLADVRAALSFIRCRAGELGIDGNRLVLLGEDSGAQLTALVAAERRCRERENGNERRGVPGELPRGRRHCADTLLRTCCVQRAGCYVLHTCDVPCARATCDNRARRSPRT